MVFKLHSRYLSTIFTPTEFAQSLLKQSPLTGYEISKQSGVPRSMIYQSINKLVSNGAINEVQL